MKTTFETPSKIGTHFILMLLAIWFLGAFAVAASGAMQAPGPFRAAAAILLPVVIFCGLMGWNAAFRRGIGHLSIRSLILVHLLRFFGFLFLLFNGRGLAPEWAVPAAWGDIVVAALAGPMAWLATPIDRPARWWSVMAFNLAGIADIIAAPATAVLQSLREPASMDAMTRLPLGLVPAFFVPLAICAHIALSLRLFELKRASGKRAANAL